MKNTNEQRLKKLLFSVFTLGIIGIVVGCSFTVESRESKTKTTIEKQKGAHVFGKVDTNSLQPFRNNNIQWISLVSWGFQEDYNSPQVEHHNGDSTAIEKHNQHWIEKINQVRAAGFKVFFKPHIWITNPSEGKWRSEIFPDNEADWETWKTSYRNFIIRYAKIAQQTEVEMFSIGMEFSRLVVEKPQFWEALIKEVRTIYTGKLTYAANWYKEYENVTFWNDLDYIGVQAYFPLVNNRYPSVEELSNGWDKHLPILKSVSKKYKKQILFTEIGYKSTSDSAIEPWRWIENTSEKESPYSAETQANCYKAFFNTVWKKDWFAGVHFWQLRTDYTENPRIRNRDFTPQGKPAEIIIRQAFE